MATPAIKSLEQMNRVISRLGVHLQSFADRKARLESRVAKARQAHDDAVNRLNELNRHEAEGINRSGAAIFAYVVPRLKELLPDKSEANVGAGKLVHRHRNIGALEYTDDEAATIAEVEAKFPIIAEKIIKTTKKIRKDVLKNDYPEVLAELDSAHAGPVDTLSIQPFNTNERLTLPYSEFQRLAVGLGFMDAVASVPLLPEPNA
jgi:prefoldin subunit 5